MLLALDVGGTKVRLGLYERNPASAGPAQFRESFRRVVVERVESKSAASLEAIIVPFLETHGVLGKIEAACVGVPGPVLAGTVKVTNLPWFIREDDLKASAKIPKVRLVNDLAATVAALPYLCEDEITVLHAGKPARECSVYAVVAPGTGLGQSYMLINRQGARFVLPSEGGHVEFAPKTQLQFDLLLYLTRKLKKRVSIERVLSGPGLFNIYSFLRDCAYHDEPPELHEELAAGDKAAVISQHALSERYEICVKTLDLFIEILGSHAGDTVLTYLATGGLFLGGGIPPKILPRLLKGRINAAYLDKGRMASLVEATPLAVIKDDHAALLGAASLAAEL